MRIVSKETDIGHSWSNSCRYIYEIKPWVCARHNIEHFSQREIYTCLIEPGESPFGFRGFFTWVYAAMNNFVIKAVFSSSSRSRFCIFIKLFHQYSWAEQISWVSKNYSLTQWTLIYIKVANVVAGISEWTYLCRVLMPVGDFLRISCCCNLQPKVFLLQRSFIATSEGTYKIKAK